MLGDLRDGVQCSAEQIPIKANDTSSLSVLEFTRVAFRNTAKALGFVVLLEGTMVTSKTVILGYAALALLIALNALSAGLHLALEHHGVEPRGPAPR